MSPRSLLMIRLGVAVAVVLGALGALPGASRASAQAAPATASAVQWSQTSLTEPIKRLYTPASGAFFAQTAAGLARSDDGGTTWHTVSLPAAPVDRPGAIVVDLTNHATIYLAAADGIYKTADDARSWTLIAPVDPKYPRFQALAVSPVDANVLYTIATSQSLQTISFKRSTDGGQTWDEPDDALNRNRGSASLTCYWVVYLLQPHPVDPNGLYRAFSCETRGLQVTLRRSHDGGATWQALLGPIGATPHWLVGGQHDAPDRLVMGANTSTMTFGGYLLTRSDDDGATWKTIEEYKEGGQTNRGPNVFNGGLAMDPTRSDRLLLGLNASGRTGESAPPEPLRLSEDGGLTWTDVTPPDLPKITDLKFGIDGRTMFAATESGLWRAAAP